MTTKYVIHLSISLLLFSNNAFTQCADIVTTGTYCANDDPFNLVAATPGGTWSGNGITNSASGLFDPSVAGAGIHTIQYLGAGTCTDTGYANLTVNPIPHASMMATTTQGCVPLSTIFYADSMDPIVSWNWDFDDLTSSSLASPSHVYTMTGCYDVHLSYTHANGCINDATINCMISVYPVPVAEFSYEWNSFGTSINFTNLSVDANSYYWDFDGLGTSTNTNPVFSFPEDSLYYTVCLYALSVNGCADSICHIVDLTNVNENLNASNPMRVYPNPFTTSITTNANYPGDLLIIDAYGKTVVRESIGTAQRTIQLNDLPCGIYSYYFTNEQNSFTKKATLIKVDQ